MRLRARMCEDGKTRSISAEERCATKKSESLKGYRKRRKTERKNRKHGRRTK